MRTLTVFVMKTKCSVVRLKLPAITILRPRTTTVHVLRMTNAAYVAVAALLMALVTATATSSMSVVFVVVTASLLAIAIAMVISWMR